MGATLLILAAGMGSRYGGLKQIDRFGPSGETIMDYAVYDALAAGFTKIVFVIRRDFESEFRALVSGKYEKRVNVDYVLQALTTLPPGFSPPAGRGKPWGTAHAIWCARERVREPFLSINADDYYGKASYKTAAEFLGRPLASGSVPEYCVVGYPVLQTLSPHGAVARAICDVDEQGFLKSLVERSDVRKVGSTVRYLDESGTAQVLKGDEVVSMNMLGFSPVLFEQLGRHLARFLETRGLTQDRAECLIPVVIGDLIKEKAARVRVLPTFATWFGVTHANDKPGVIETLRAMVARGDYPSPIWTASSDGG